MMLEKSRVLVVDDERLNINIMVDILHHDYEIMVAKNGEMALKLVRSDPPPDLILLDIMMPDMDGYEVCRRIKADESTKDIPIIFITAMGSERDENNGLRMGAVDYIVKPICPDIVLARVKTQMALRLAFRQLEEKNQELLYEREVIEYVLHRMSHSPLFDSSHLRIVKSPVDTISGDILLAAFGPQGNQHILLGDFTGHGLSAAIGGPMVADIFYSRTALGYPMERLVAEINQVLCDKLPDHMFMVGCFLEINKARNQMTVWNCAMPDILVFRDGQLYQIVKSAYLARGLFLRTEKPGTLLHVQPGDLLFVYTDGILEETDKNGDIFGNDRIVSMIQENVSSGKPIDTLLVDLARFREGKPQKDDVIIIEVMC